MEMDVKAPPATTLPAVRPSPADLAKRINEKYSEIVASLRTTFIRAVEIGELLEQAKDRVGHGNFEAWLSSHCQLSFSTARRYMKLAEDRPKIEEQLKLETASGKSVKLTDLNLSSARRLLAAPPKKQEGSGKPTTEKYKTIENDLITCLKDLREKAESYASGTIAALNDTVEDIKIVIEQAQARRMP
jgi:hypothetical protein